MGSMNEQGSILFSIPETSIRTIPLFLYEQSTIEKCLTS